MTPLKRDPLVARARQLFLLPMRSCSVISLVALVFLLPVPLRADGVVTFFDGTETLSATVSDPLRMSVPACNGTLSGMSGFPGPVETCAAVIEPPDGATNSSSSFSPLFFIADPNGLVSDVLGSDHPFTNRQKLLLEFFSDFEAGVPCGSCFTEDGTVQTIGSITWLNDAGATIAVDTIKFQSDVSEVPVPEPTSIMLLLTGLAGLGFTKLRNKIARPNSPAS